MYKLPAKECKEWLGNPTYKKTSLNQHKNELVLATGLAWTEIGGDVLEIEASAISGKGVLTLNRPTGRSDARISASGTQLYSCTIYHTGPTSIILYNSKDMHIHIPEGATPKDGPSAGITMCTALVSAFTKNPTCNNLAMTGEITLQGRVLAIGGLKEKLLAAKQHGIKRVIVPQENFDDIQEILKDTDLQGIELIFVKNMDEVLEAAFTVSPFSKAKQQEKAKKSARTRKKKKTD